ncbi:MAG TPA: HD domain-containing phosphohydrolase [Gammaproteobacteria bacterium]|nr:HD domain-containing phosphohydrolase [Gammaproteobacteria bacterium]
MDNTHSRRPILIGLALLFAVILGGIWLIFSYLDLERERDLGDWRIRLGLIADDRAAGIDQWLSREFANLGELANNASLQLYLSQLSTHTDTPADVEPAQLGYLRNLINAAAERGGYRAVGEPEPLVRANLPTANYRGLALLDHEGRVVVATPGMPALDPEDRALALHVIGTGQPALRDLRVSAQGQATLGFLVPIATVQGMQDASGQSRVGVLLGIKPAATDLYPLLANRGGLTRRDETLLVRLENTVLINLSPLADGSAPLQRRLPLSTLDQEMLRALRNPGEFAKGIDYRGISVLMTSRALSGAPWLLIQKTDAQEALKESEDHRRFLLTSFLLTLFFISASLIAAWRHGSSVRAQAMTARLQEKTRMLEGQTRLLHGVTDTLSDYLFLLDDDHRLIFANRAFEAAIGVPQADLFGKTLASIFGPDTAQRLETCISQPATPSTQPENLTLKDRDGLYQCIALPLPNPAGSGHATLVVLHDVTALHESERKRADLLRQLITALMRAVDKHDPHSANHSSRTAAVAVAIGRELQLPASDLRALDLAANLANVGKIFIPKEVLTKSGALSDEEQETLKRHVQYALDILSSLEFEGPVLATIAQKQELMDGSGYPQGLSGEAILLTARILAVANAFVALVSPRAYRDEVPIPQALDQLLAESKDKYDRHVVAALFHIAENRTDLTDLAHLTGSNI